MIHEAIIIDMIFIDPSESQLKQKLNWWGMVGNGDQAVAKREGMCCIKHI